LLNVQIEPAWTIRAYRPGDERALVALFERVFGRPIGEAHWRWKLKQPPSPVENVWLAVHDDIPIFQYAAIPTRYRLPSGEATVMVSVDTMTAPEFQRRGLLSTVGRHAYEAWRAAGVPFVIGLPNERWGSRAAALGWRSLFSLHWLVRPLRPEALLARRMRLPVLGRLTPLGALWNGLAGVRMRPDATVRVHPLERAGPEFDRLWQRCAADTPFSAVRDSAWVNWRYLDAPAFAYRVLLAERAVQPAGYAAYRLHETASGTVGFIAELFAAPDDAGGRDTLLSGTIAAIRATGAEHVSTLAIPGTALYRAFRRAGFLRGRGAFGVQIVPLDPNLPVERMRDPNSWGMAGGDFDVI
jgi:hypothetical protein